MKLTGYDKACIILIATLFAVSFYLYPSLPDQIPMHWNAAGEVDDYGSPAMIFLFPGIIALVFLTLLFLPRLAVFRENIEKFKYFGQMKLGLVLFFIVMYSITLLPNFGYDNSAVITSILPAIGILFIFLGYIIRNVRRNFWIGIRTPWTLANDAVWDKTHQLGGKLFMFAGVVTLIASITAPIPAYKIMLALVFALIGFSIAYSYWLFVKIGRKHQL